MLKISVAFSLLILAGCQTQQEVINNNVGAMITIDQARQSLAKGINLSNWFNDYSDPNQYGSRFNATDMQRIKMAGFTYVRLPIASTILFNNNSPATLSPAVLQYVDAAVQLAHQAGLVVLLDPIHNSNDTFEKRLATEAGFIDKVKIYWQSVAKYFSKYDTDKLFFEVYNEPHIGASGSVSGVNKSWWWPMQYQLIQSIRQVTLNHYIVAGGEGWNGRQDLLASIPYNQPNIIYNFHFYDPFLFTHQGATWTGWAPAMEAYHVPYPSSPTAVDSLIKKTTYQDLKDALNWYGSQKYNYDSLYNWLEPVAGWAKKYNVTVMCNEFGSYKAVSPRASRLSWIKDTRLALEANQILWAMWEYDEGFGWINYSDNTRSFPVADTEVISSLGF